jgi:hypothetical protein
MAMNLIRKEVIRLRKILAQQLVQFLDDECVEPNKRIPVENIVRDFRFDDEKEQGKHTVEHGRGLSEGDVDYLFRQSDEIFEEKFKNTDNGAEPYWVMKPSDTVGDVS